MVNCRKEVESLRAYVPGKPIDDVKKEFNLDKVTKLASNENPYGCSEEAKEAIIETLKTPSLYPDGNCTKLRNAIAEKMNVETNQLVFGAGSDELLSIIGRTFIGPSDEAITCTPSFAQYSASVKTMGGKLIEVPLINHTYDLNGIVDKVTDRTKVIFIANPNNPTGTIITEKEQLEFIKKIPSNILIVLDEAYYEYVYDDNYPESLPLLKEYDNLIILRTFSKMYGLASLRVGYGIAHPQIIDYINRVRGPFNVTTSAQEGALAALSDEEFVKNTFEANKGVKEYTYKRLDELGIDYIEGHGNFLMIDFKKPSMDLFIELQKKGVIVRPGFFFGMDTYQRVTLGTKEEMDTFFEVVKQLI
ncbi:histidinol-phosphate transaminase [Vallitalea sp.]|jgi:histidinol-phosphate aminotransferase|uniref:histidinol-phosphate transaminase n=1 Tax=Vallitalea sp. TaxID=1882829 RepID=UPI0025CF4A1A|nr:histidinol-phosphate transaminase [Vallitalea sp.]MCT4686762.1 histidinol-phosphate transaminase [Vallitalea sp.]